MYRVHSRKRNVFLSAETYLRIQSHIIGLGLNDNGTPVNICDGMAYQRFERRKAGVLVQLLKNNKLDRRFVLIHGRRSSGKSAISKAIIIELGCSNNNVVLLPTELEDPTRNQLQTISQALRKVLKLRIAQENYVINGEVVKLSYDEPAPGVSGSVGSIVMRTRQMAAIYGLGAKMLEKLKAMRVQKGDIISIESGTGEVQRLGQTDAFQPDTYVPCPSGELAIQRPIYHTVSMHEIDVFNSFVSKGQDVEQLNYVEITDKLRELVNRKVAKWLEDGKAELVRGVVLIEELPLVNLECFLYLEKTSPNFFPIIIMNCIDDSLEVLPFSFDFLKHVFKIETPLHNDKGVTAILSLRCLHEKLIFGEKSFIQLKIYAKINLQFAVQLMYMISSLCEQMRSIPQLADVYAGYNTVLVSEVFRQTLIEQQVELKWDCTVTYENVETVLKLVIESN